MIRSTLLLRSGAAIALALLATGCGCSDEGCVSTLSIRLQSKPSEPFRIDVFSPQYAPRSFDCPDPQACEPGAVFESYLPQAATVRVTIGNRVRETAIQPDYRSIKPNGVFCGDPQCLRATVTVPPP